jgi:hypothetical protein
MKHNPMRYLLKLFGFYKDPVSALAGRSANAFRLFHKMGNELKTINEEIITYHAGKQKLIDKTISEQQTLMQQHHVNSKLINKITEFLN